MMDKVDERMLKELDNNPVIPVSRLAKSLRVSQQVADYRIKRLVNVGVISKFGTIINLKALRLEHYRLFFTFNAKKQFSDENIFDFLRSCTGVYWAACTGGKYDLHIALFVVDFSDHDRFIDEFNKQFPGLIKDFKSCYGLEHRVFRHKYLGNESKPIVYTCSDKAVDVDKLDLRILYHIQDNARFSSVELGRALNVSYKTVLNRVSSLVRSGVILGYRLFFSSVEEKPFIVLFSFRDYSRDAEKKLINFVEQHKNVTQVVRLFGLYSLFLHVRCSSFEDAQKFIVLLRDNFSIIDDCEIVPVFRDISINLLPIPYKSLSLPSLIKKERNIFYVPKTGRYINLT